MGKNKKGQLGVIGILMFFMAVVIAAAFIPSIANSQQSMAQTYIYNNTVSVAAAGSSVFLTGNVLVGSPASVLNESGATINCANNFTVQTAVSPTTGNRGIQLVSSPLIADFSCKTKINISYTYGAEGYVADSGARSISQLVVLFASLALIGAAIFFFIKQGGLDFIDG